MKTKTLTVILIVLTNIVFSQKYRELVYTKLPNNTLQIDRKEGNVIPLEEFSKYCEIEVSFTKNFDSDEFCKHFEKKLNEYRKSKGLNPVEMDTSLKSFVVDHSEWITRTGIVSHSQTTQPYLGFAGRAKKFNIYNRLISECASMSTAAPSIFFFMEYDPKVNRYDYLAETMIFGFKNSPSHNTIMLDPDIKKFYCTMTFNEYRSSQVLSFSKK